MPRSKKPDASPNLDELSFEEAYRRLGEMVETLESGGLPLAEATGVYEQGMALVQHCNQLLNQAELKITQLRDSYPGPPAADVLDWLEDADAAP